MNGQTLVLVSARLQPHRRNSAANFSAKQEYLFSWVNSSMSFPCLKYSASASHASCSFPTLAMTSR